MARNQTSTHRAWPFQEAAQIVKQRRPTGDRPVLFETGFGPSGFPHLGHFSEGVRTSWVRNACEHLYGLKTRLLCFSDDMDGLRKVPSNLPQPEMLAAHLGKPLHAVPDPFGRCASFSDQMNAKLCEFFDASGFDYEFQSSREAYVRGDFDEGLSILLEKSRRGSPDHRPHAAGTKPSALVALLPDLYQLWLDHGHAGHRLPPQPGHRELHLRPRYRPLHRMRRERRAIGARRQRQGGLESRLGVALVHLRGRLRNVRQRPRRFGAPVLAHRPPDGQAAAGRLVLRIFSRRGGARVGEQCRSHGGDGGRVEKVRANRIPALFPLPKSQAGQAAALGHRPQVR